MKNDELEPIQQVGVVAVFFGLDLLLNNGSITSAFCKMVVENANQQIEKSNEIK